MQEFPNNFIVGRNTELERASAVIEHAFAGHGQTLSITGEPGIGKSVLLEWISSAAENLGARVFTGRCYDDRGSPAYWPWNEIIRSHLQDLDESVANELYGDSAGRLATAFPALRGRFEETSRLTAVETPAESRFLLHDEFAGVLRRAAEQKPIVILLDDLHWADEGSLLLLEFLSKSLANSPVLIAFAHWDLRQAREAPLTRLLGGLSRERSFHRLQLRRLNRDDCKALISSLGPPGISEQVENAVFQITEGNPFFIGEIAQLLGPDEVSYRELNSLEMIPDSIRSVMIRRLDALSSGTVEILETAAIIGHDFDIDILRASLDSDRVADMMQHLEEAETFRFIEKVEDQTSRWRFHHGLIQRTLAAELPANRSELLHAAVLNGFEDVLGEAVDEHASELAAHSIRAESLLGAERVAHYCLVAGEQALEALVPDVARRHFETAISRTDMDQCSDLVARLLSGYTHSLFDSGSKDQVTTAVVHSRLAVECFIRLNRPYDAALHLIRPIRADYGLTGAAELFRAVIALIDPESREAGLLHAGLIIWSYMDEFDFEASMASYERAMQIANATNDEYLKLLCLSNYGSVNRHYGDRTKDVEASAQAAALAMKLGQRYLEAQARFVTSTAYMFEGRLSMARSDVERGLQLARELNNLPRVVSAISAKIELAIVTCDFDLVRSLANEAIDLDPDDGRVLRDLAYAEYLTGNFEEAGKVVSSLIANQETHINIDRSLRSRSASSSTSLLLAATVGTVMTGDLELLTQVRPWLLAEMERLDQGLGEGRPIAGLMCTRLEPDSAMAARLLATVEAPINWKWMRASIGSVALMAGDEGRARAEFASSYELFQDEFSPLPLAWTCLEYSDALIKLNNPGDTALVSELHELGIKIATDYGIQPIREMLEKARDAFAGDEFEAERRPGGLSEREIEVLRLVAEGLSNSEIAEQLIISPHTVNRHVTNLFSKLDVTSRASATDRAHRLGIV